MVLQGTVAVHHFATFWYLLGMRDALLVLFSNFWLLFNPSAISYGISDLRFSQSWLFLGRLSYSEASLTQDELKSHDRHRRSMEAQEEAAPKTGYAALFFCRSLVYVWKKNITSNLRDDKQQFDKIMFQTMLLLRVVVVVVFKWPSNQFCVVFFFFLWVTAAVTIFFRIRSSSVVVPWLFHLAKMR